MSRMDGKKTHTHTHTSLLIIGLVAIIYSISVVCFFTYVRTRPESGSRFSIYTPCIISFSTQRVGLKVSFLLSRSPGSLAKVPRYAPFGAGRDIQGEEKQAHTTKRRRFETRMDVVWVNDHHHHHATFVFFLTSPAFIFSFLPSQT